MCQGIFSPERRAPLITASIIIPELEISKEAIFIIDTGAETTCLSGLTALDAGLHPDQLSEGVPVFESSVTGVGGDESASHFVGQSALLVFEEMIEEGETWELHIENLDGIIVSDGTPYNLLGRDILHRFSMDYNPQGESIEMERLEDAPGEYESIQRSEQTLPDFSTLRDGAAKLPE